MHGAYTSTFTYIQRDCYIIFCIEICRRLKLSQYESNRLAIGKPSRVMVTAQKWLRWSICEWMVIINGVPKISLSSFILFLFLSVQNGKPKMLPIKLAAWCVFVSATDISSRLSVSKGACMCISMHTYRTMYKSDDGRRVASNIIHGNDRCMQQVNLVCNALGIFLFITNKMHDHCG